MLKMKLSSFSQDKVHSRGQVFIIIAISFLVLLAFVGLAVDAGLLFIAYGRLVRSVDAAALAAAAQFREGRTVDEMEATAANAMTVNGVQFTDIEIELCDYSAPLADQDPQLCTQPFHKKLVRITVSADIPLAFLRVLGYDSLSLSASAISEAASMDVVLVIDISESMAWDAGTGDPLRDPSVCNNTSLYDGSEDGGEYPTFPDGIPGECHPFEEVKNSAAEFVLRVLDKPEDEEEDRLAIITFGNGWSSDPNMGTKMRTAYWTSDAPTALSIIRDLKIAEPDICNVPDPTDPNFGAIYTYWGPCRKYIPSESTNFSGFYCYSCNDSADLSYKTTTNIGGGLLLAGDTFNYQTREDALWVVILLTDGMANATDPESNDDITNFSTYPVGYCPNEWTFPLCQDEDVSTRHSSGNLMYDADDYARDMADYVGCYPTNQADACGSVQGQGAVIFTIGLGEGVIDTSNEVSGLPYGTALLRYIGAVGDDGDPATDPCIPYWEDAADWEEWCGNYYFSPEGNQLSAVFQDIASRVFTRLTR